VSASTRPLSSSSSTQACVQAATNYLAAYAKPPTTLGSGFTPLPSKPKPGKKVIAIYQGTIPGVILAYKGFTAAAKSVGWTVQGISYDGTPAALEADILQAVAQKPYAIFAAGVTPSAIAPGIAATKAAGILFEDASQTTLPESDPGFAVTALGTPTNQLEAKIAAYGVMKDSGCKANVAVFNLTDLDILTVETNSFISTLQKHCPACKTSYTVLPVADLGTPTLTNTIVSKVQSSPGVDWIYTPYGNITDGLPTALATAGLTGIKIAGNVPSSESIADLRTGGTTLEVSQSSLLSGWTDFDALLRAYESGKIENQTANAPYVVMTKQNVGSATNPVLYPTNYAALYEKLWHVGKGG
jgi:ABC-type sugar transport system substrate-binding protein